MATDNKALARRIVDEIWNQGKMEVIEQIYANDFTGHIVGAPGPLHGRSDVRQFVNTYRSAVPDLQMTIEEIYVVGDRVFMRWNAMGTHKGECMGVAPTGRRLSTSGVDLLRLANGKVAEAWGYWDLAGFASQLGLTFQQPTTASQQPSQQPSQRA